jgi:transposase-like protein
MSVKRQSRNRIASQPRSFWEQHYRRWHGSGLSKADYCRKHQLYAGTFYNWCHQLAEDDSGALMSGSVPANPEPLELIPVRIKSDREALPEPIPANADRRAQICCGPVSVQLPADLAPN